VLVTIREIERILVRFHLFQENRLKSVKLVVPDELVVPVSMLL